MGGAAAEKRQRTLGRDGTGGDGREGDGPGKLSDSVAREPDRIRASAISSLFIAGAESRARPRHQQDKH